MPRGFCALFAVAGLLTVCPPAGAQTPAPTIHTFAPPDARPGATYDTGCNWSSPPSGGWDGGAHARYQCGRFTSVTLFMEQRQALFELFVRTSGAFHAPEGLPDVLSVTAGDCADRAAGRLAPPPVELSPPPAEWTPVVVADPAGEPTIGCVTVYSKHDILDIDDVGFSPTTDQPDTTVAAFPGSPPSAVAANQPGASVDCVVDGAERACPPPAPAGLAPGLHTFTAAARDRWGRLDPTPAAHQWEVAAPVSTPGPVIITAADADRDGVPDLGDNCRDDANSDQADVDGDRIGDACDRLPPGNVAPIAGVNAVMRVLSGDVFVKLPADGAARDLRVLRAPFQESGFVPLKGVASLPMGSTVDARKGRLFAEVAANGRPLGDARRRTGSAQFAAGIFRIQQARARRATSKPKPTTAALVSGTGAERACARSTRQRPLKGVVRGLTTTADGRFRVDGGASASRARDAIFITTDRCDGTITEVGRGTVHVRDRRRKRTVTVPGGRAYHAKAPLFLPLKGRPRPPG